MKKVPWRLLMLPLLLCLLLTGCEDFYITEVDSPFLENEEQRLVVNSYISPQDTLIRVFVQRSTTYGNNPLSQEVGSRAEVFMGKKGGPLKQLPWMPDRDLFGIDAREIGVVPGEQYVLKVVSHAGEEVEAECQVPHVDFTGFDIQPPEFYTPPHSISREFTLDWSFRAPATAEERYYSSGAFRKSYGVSYGDDTWDTVFVNVIRYPLERGQEFVAGRNAAAFSFGVTDWHNTTRPDSTFIYVLQTDVHYYRFHKSLVEYFYRDNESPFSQAVNIYSNIRGGLGVFAGYNRREYFAGF